MVSLLAEATETYQQGPTKQAGTLGGKETR